MTFGTDHVQTANVSNVVALAAAQGLAPFTVNSVSVVIVLLWPLVWLSQQITRLLKRNKDQNVFSHSEFLAMAEIGVEAEGSVIESENVTSTILDQVESLGGLVPHDALYADGLGLRPADADHFGQDGRSRSNGWSPHRLFGHRAIWPGLPRR